MRTKEIEVPQEVMGEIAELIAEHNLDNEIQGTNDEGDIIIEFEYEKEDRKAIYEIMDIVEEYREENEEKE